MTTRKHSFYARSVPGIDWPPALLLAVLLSLVALAAWDLHLRSLGLEAGDIGDGKSHWAEERRKIDRADPDAIAIIGASRILFDTDLDLFEARTGLRPVQLALPGTNARPFLEDLAQDPDFAGLVIVGMTEVSFFREGSGLFGGAMEYYRSQSPAQRVGHALYVTLSRRLAFIDDDYGLDTLLRRTRMPERAGIEGPYADVWKLSVASDDRQTRMWHRIETDPYLRDHARHAWNDFEGDPITTETVDSVIESTRRDMARIRARGGEVIFVRPPSAGPVLANEKLRAPRSRVWDRLIEETSAVGIHFEDHPEMQNMNLPEWSHLAAGDARAFTEAYVDVMMERVSWLSERLSER